MNVFTLRPLFLIILFLSYLFILRSPEGGDWHAGAGVAGSAGQNLSLPHSIASPRSPPSPYKSLATTLTSACSILAPRPPSASPE